MRDGYLQMKTGCDTLHHKLRKDYPVGLYVVRNMSDTLISRNSHSMLLCQVEVRGKAKLDGRTLLAEPFKQPQVGSRLPTALVGALHQIRILYANFGDVDITLNALWT